MEVNVIGLLQQYYIQLTAFGTTVGTGVFVYKKLIHPIVELGTKYYDIIEKIDTIFKEITPNSGTSIKDKIDNIENEVALSRERFWALSADNANAIFETDVDGNCVRVNRTYSDLAQRTPSEIMGHGWVNAICELDRDRVTKDWYKAVEEDREFSSEYAFKTPGGEYLPVKCISYKLADCRGKRLGYLGIVNPTGAIRERYKTNRMGLEK